MSPQLPSFLRRRLRLHEARRALLAGRPEEALRQLDDPALALSDEAGRMREKVLDVLCREAGRHAAAGERERATELLALVEGEDPERARTWRRKLGEERASADLRARSGLRAGADSGILTALESLLEQLRDERRAAASPNGSKPGGPDSPAPLPPAQRAQERPAPARSLRFHLAVDDAGEYLVAAGNEIVIGHARAAICDLPLLADLDPRHALLRPSESFHAGPGWSVAPVADQHIEVGGRPVGAAGLLLADGDRVRLSPRLAFVFRAPEAGSASALLELEGGLECAGAARVLLMRPGSSGALRLGGRLDRHVPVRGLRHEVRLELDEGELVLSSAAGLVVHGADPAATVGEHVRVPLPPRGRIDFALAAGESGRPPFAFSLRPFEEAAPAGRTHA